MNFVSIRVGDTPTIPPQVQAAFSFIEFARSLTDPCESSSPKRELSKGEAALLRAAHEVVRLYLTGEQSFASAPSNAVRVPGEGESEPQGARREGSKEPPCAA